MEGLLMYHPSESSAAPVAVGGQCAPIRDIDQLLAQAHELESARDLHAVASIVDRLLNAGHCEASLALLFARSAEDIGREGEAFQVVLRAIAASETQPPRTVSSLHFAAAKLLDRMGRYDEAFAHATRANAPWASSYDPQRMEAMVSSCIELFSQDKLPGIARATRRDATPVFIIGMPRSGSTLVEQILASHPQVFGGGELRWVNRLWHALLSRVSANGSLDEALTRMSAADADAVAAEYLQQLRGLHATAARVTDKNLSNFMHLGLIWALFPGARVIHCRRDPLDVGISSYMTDFADVLPFTCSLPALGHFNRQLDRLMSHWKQVLDLPFLEVDYEVVVDDLAGQAHRLVQFLDLPWDEQCLQFHRNPRPVETASRSQVRRPIFTSSIARWRHYEKWLGPLQEALQVK